mmetsp:Transcript_6362/g.16145  ORF Transcript_6362/g.16145 Transcript_6362/m.16145 type:complete len:363 (+) Transcript_6362:475-1563(+)|eukprot:CAMPEP_0198235220 /NCGR_PEP_ID=MMETSP1446-20131203/1117_1 /TAXON_ID=1461542 ORGANISM="Unidentified sp, Strain CCMP2111" /NCGR_SAMPLE_ID=MMETSP1446 /ASSEMBLY_ACC=CAM_ASM_001112 /LENGTH=362 /DNA_ID=CAMNT_0043916275 /DNA_START=379 /DNA_END=1467 /DNA_ORIENTATION=-
MSEKGKSSLSLFRKAGMAALLTVDMASINISALNVPWKRRRETFFTLVWLLSLSLLPLLCILLSIYFLWNPMFRIPMLVYLGWIFIDKSPQSGSKGHYLGRVFFWKYVRDYFPISLIKTSEIKPDRSYVFGYHPHGVISTGALINFGTSANGFEKLFPGIRIHILTLASNFNVPFGREWLLRMGICDASKKTCHNILSRGSGESILLAVGGAEESLDAFPGQYVLTLRKRKGFVRVALKTGASLVPVIAFGENELWNAMPNPVGSKLRTFQERMKHLLKFTFPVVYGRGVFNYHYGLMPHRRSIVTVVGKPILVDSPCDIDSEEGKKKVDKFHALYISRLTELFEKHKTKCTKYKGLELVIK